MLRAMTKLAICQFETQPFTYTLVFYSRYIRLHTLTSLHLFLGLGWGQIIGILADGQRDVHQHERSYCHDACYRPWHPAA